MNKSNYIYLDHAATTPMREVAFEAYKKTEMNAYANSSGGHALSRKAKNILEESREFIASCFGAAPNEITFTSGGTEADNWIIKSPFIDKDYSAELTTTQIEHEAVLASAENVHSMGFHRRRPPACGVDAARGAVPLSLHPAPARHLRLA